MNFNSWTTLWLYLCSTTVADQLIEDCLVSISNVTDGTKFTINCETAAGSSYEEVLSGHHLSPAAPAPSILATNNTSVANTSSFIIFLPLSNSQGLLELTYNETSGWTHKFANISLGYSVLYVVRLLDTFFTIGIDVNSNEKRLLVNRLNVKNMNISDFYFSNAAEIPTRGNRLSNVLFVEQQLYVAINNFIYHIRPINHLINVFDEPLPLDYCHTLQYAGDYALIATCTDGENDTYTSYYDIGNDGRVLNTTYDVVPFPCQYSNHKLIINITSGLVTHHNWSSNTATNFPLHGVFHSGACFNDLGWKSPLFIYSNTERIVYAINISLGPGNEVQLSSSACLSDECKPFLSLGRYLLIQEQRGDTDEVVTCVKDPGQNYSNVFYTDFDASWFALVQRENNESEIPPTQAPNGSNNSTSTSTPSSTPQSNQMILVILLSVIVPVVIGICFIIVISIVAVYIRNKKCRRTRVLTTSDAVTSSSETFNPISSGPATSNAATSGSATSNAATSGSASSNAATSDAPLQLLQHSTTTTVAMTVSDNSGNGNMVPPGRYVESTSFSPDQVTATANSRTNTEQKRNDVLQKEAHMSANATN